ncbi:Nuclear transcription factor Y subunit A-10, partial [Cucurbita argyrosperma subsp. argyrosperma]
MAPQTGYLKEHEGIVPNSLGQLSSSPTRLWSAAFGLGSHSIFGDFGQVKEQLDSNGKEFAATKQATHGLEKLNTAPFSIYPGDTKNSVDAQKHSPVFSLQSPLSEYHNRFELGFGQPLTCENYPYMEQHYGILSAYGPQIPGRVMLPMRLTTDDEPIYVNAKQYHGIIRRRQIRAKAMMKNRPARTRKPYIHESRHLHAMRRPRGSGGRFLNMKNQPNEKSSMVPKKVDDVNLSDLTGSQCSEVLQSESGTLNSQNEAKEGRGFNLLSSEVSSMFSRGLQRFQINHIGPSMQSLAEIIDGGGHGMVLPKWVAAADNCCDLCF